MARSGQPEPMEILRHLITLFVGTASDRNRLAIENAVLRQQILVLQRGVTRARLEDTDAHALVVGSKLARAETGGEQGR